MQATLASHEAEDRRRDGAASPRVPERRCILTGESLPAGRLVRFVVGPDGAVVPDIEGRLPGRGLWLRAARDIVGKAAAGRSFAKAARAAVSVAPDLPDQVERLLARRCLDLLGLARRTGAAVAGYEKATAFARRCRIGLVLIAGDAGESGRGRLAGIAPEAPVIELFSGAELGAIFGRERTVHVAVAEGGLADRLIAECARLAGFRPARAPGNES